MFKRKDKDQERSSVFTEVRNSIRKGVGSSVVRQVKSKASDKWSMQCVSQVEAVTAAHN